MPDWVVILLTLVPLVVGISVMLLFRAGKKASNDYRS